MVDAEDGLSLLSHKNIRIGRCVKSHVCGKSETITVWHAASTLRTPARIFRAIPKSCLPNQNCLKSAHLDPHIYRTLLWTANFLNLLAKSVFLNFGISITGHILLKSTEGCRINRASSDFSFPMFLYKSLNLRVLIFPIYWETKCQARRRPSWLAVVPNTGCPEVLS